MKGKVLMLFCAMVLAFLSLPGCSFEKTEPTQPVAQEEPVAQEKPVAQEEPAAQEEWEKSGKLKETVEYYQWQIHTIRFAPRKVLIEALGQDIYEELNEAYQKGGTRALMEKIPEFFTWNDDPLARRYHTVFAVFRYRSGRCGEFAHFAFGILYLFGIRQLEIVHSTADHVWLIVEGSHYDPGIVIEDRYNKDAYRHWKAPFAFMLAIDIDGNVRDVTAEYVDITPEIIERRKGFIDEE